MRPRGARGPVTGPAPCIAKAGPAIEPRTYHGPLRLGCVNVLKLSVALTAQELLDECSCRGLAVRSERELGGGRVGRHWHLAMPGRPGTLEVDECQGQVFVKVHPLRDGGWARRLAAELHTMSGA